jgi:hypothetical protein
MWTAYFSKISMGFFEVHARVRKNIVGRDLHLLSGFVHFIDSVKKATRSDDGYVVDLVRLNQERMRLAFWGKHGFTGSNFEHLTFSVKANTSREDIEELIVPCVDVRRLVDRSECRFTFKNALTQPRLLEMDVNRLVGQMLRMIDRSVHGSRWNRSDRKMPMRSFLSGFGAQS